MKIEIISSEIKKSKMSESVHIQLSKEDQSKYYARTSMCKNINQDGGCPLGDKCTYAHSQSELQMPMCKYGNRCVYAYGSSEVTCKFRHPEIGYIPINYSRTEIPNIIPQININDPTQFPKLESRSNLNKSFADVVKKEQILISPHTERVVQEKEKTNPEIVIALKLQGSQNISDFLMFVKTHNITNFHVL